jgi:hypothetical protein
MSQPRYGCGAGVLDGMLYVVGGTQEKNGDYLDTVSRNDSSLSSLCPIVFLSSFVLRLATCVVRAAVPTAQFFPIAC